MKAGKKPDGSPYKSWQRMLAVVLTVAMMFTILPSDVTAAESVHGTPNKELLSEPPISSEGWTESETQTETQAQTEMEIQTETQAQTESEAQTETQAQTESEVQTETQAQTESEVQTETQAQTESEAQTETQAQTESEAQTETQAQTESEAQTETQAQIEMEIETEAQNETKMTLQEYIDQYVKNEANLKNYVRVSAAVERDQVLTGDSTVLTLRYEMNAFPNFSFGTDITQIPIKRILDAKVYIALPLGTSIANIDDPNISTWLRYTGRGPINGSADQVTQYEWYEWSIGDVTIGNSRNDEKTGAAIRLDNNGTLANGTEFLIRQEQIYVTGRCEIQDLSHETPVIQYEDIAVKADVPIKITSMASNEWNIRKKLEKPSDVDWEWDKEKDYAIINYKIEAGKLGQNDEIASDTEKYDQYGTLNFESFHIIDEIPDFIPDNSEYDPTDPAKVEVYWAGTNEGQLLQEGIDYTYDPATQILDISSYNKKDLTRVNDAPVYSAYYVRIYYPYSEMEKHFSEPVVLYSQTNTANLEYILKTETEPREDSDAASAAFEMRKQPGILSLSKIILNPDDHATFKYHDPGTKPVHGMSAEQFRKSFSGYVQFEITKVSEDPEQNGKPAVIYMAVPDENGIYHRADDKNLVINPFKDNSDPADMAATSADGIVKMALEPGVYHVRETRCPSGTSEKTAEFDVTITEGDETSGMFINQISGSGSLKFSKLGETENGNTALGGALFGLYLNKNDEQPLYMAYSRMTDQEGNEEDKLRKGDVLFTAPAGTYYLKEISAPAGYKTDPQWYEVEITEGQRTTVPKQENTGWIAENTFLNRGANGRLRLEKFVHTVDNKGNVTSKRVPESDRERMKFQLQQRVQGEEQWKDVGNEFTLDVLGGNTAKELVDLPIYTDDGILYEYRFVETVYPEGYYPEGYNEKNRASEAVTLRADQKTVIQMYNEQKASLKIQKKKISSEAISGAAQEDVVLQLYYRVKDSGEELQPYGNPVKTDKNGQTSVISDLPFVSENETALEYYILEEETKGTKPGTANGALPTKTETISGEQKTVFGPFYLNGERIIEKTIVNFSLKRKILIEKIDGDEKTRKAGASFDIYPIEEDGTRGNAVNEQPFISVEEGKQLPGIELAPGKYHIVETTPPNGYQAYRNGQLSEEDAERYGTNYQEIVIPEISQDQIRTLTFRFENYKLPELILKKQVATPDGLADALSDKIQVTIEIYKFTGNEGEPVQKSNLKKEYEDTFVVNQYFHKTVEEGTYYIKETAIDTQTGLMLPRAELYDGVKGTTVIDGEVYFGPYTVKNRVSEDGTINPPRAERFTDLVNHGTLKVRKKDSETGKNLVGSEFAVSYVDENGKTITLNEKLIIGGSGTGMLENLDVVDKNGDKIQYTITETKAPDGYQILEKPITGIELEYDALLNSDGSVKKAVIPTVDVYNKPEISLEVFKIGQDQFWNSKAGASQNEVEAPQVPLGDVELALYEVGENGMASYAGSQKTDKYGNVSFERLNSEKEYYVAEVSSNPEYPDLPDNKKLLNPAPASMPVSEFERYNTLHIRFSEKENAESGRKVIELSADLNGTKVETEKIVRKGNTFIVDEPLVNTRPSAQFEIIKWGIQGTDVKRMNDTYFTGFNLGDDLSKIHTGDGGVLIQTEDGSVMPKTETIMGTNVTHTTEDGVEGHVFSNIVRYGNIYLFKETYAPGGWKILPTYENGILLVPDEGVTESEVSQLMNTLQTNHVVRYQKEDITSVEFYNVKLGQDEGKESQEFGMVQIEIDKVLERINGDREALDGVTFELYLMDASKEEAVPIVPLASMTTGMTTAEEPGKALSAGINLNYYYRWLKAKGYEFKDTYSEENWDNIPTEKNTFAYADQYPEYTKYPYMKYQERTETCEGVMVRHTQSWKFYSDEQGKDQQHTVEFYTYEVTVGAEETDRPDNVEKLDHLLLIDVKTKVLPAGEYSEVNKTYTGDNAVVNKEMQRGDLIIWKYGYTRRDGLNYEAADHKDKNKDEWLHEQLEGDAKYAMGGVQVKLERQTETGNWETVKWGSEAYGTTAPNGRLEYNGLEPGKYRLTEVNIGTWSSEYENAHDVGYEYEFELFASGKEIHLYNPKKPQLMVRKFDRSLIRNNQALKDTQFTIKGGDLDLTVRAGDFYNAQAELVPIEIEADTVYTITETQEVNGYTKEYSVSRKDAIAKFEGQDWPENNRIYVDFLNDMTGKLVITKKESKTGKPLEGAKFVLSRIAFEDQEFEKTPVVGNFYFAEEDKRILKAGLTPPETTDPRWKPERELFTEADGRAVFENLEPGWYKITEEKAPENYVKSETETVIKIAGSLDQPIERGGQVNVPTISREFTNEPYGKLTIQKTYVYGYELGSDPLPTAIFEIYKNKSDQVPAYQVQIQGQGSGSVRLPAGKYFVKEKQMYGWEISKWNQTSVPSDSDGFFEVEIKEGENKGVFVSAENRSVKSKMTLIKLPEGTKEEQKGLKGAEFTVTYKDPHTGQEVAVNNGTQSHFVTDEHGLLSVEFVFTEELLTEEVRRNGLEFTFTEVKAPESYALDKTPHTVMLKPNQNIKYSLHEGADKNQQALVFYNKGGLRLEVHKRNNVLGKDENASMPGITFHLYEINRQTKEAVLLDTQVTDSNSSAIFDNIEKKPSEQYQYALGEVMTEQDQKFYVGLDEVYLYDEKTHSVTGASFEKSAVMVDGIETEVFLIPENIKLGTYHIHAYNRPKTKLYINKGDAQNEKEAASAKFSIYRVNGQGSVPGENESPLELYYSNTSEDKLHIKKGTVLETGTSKRADGSKIVTTISVMLEPGWYYIKEVETGEPYFLNGQDERLKTEDWIEITGEEDEIVSVTFLNRKDIPKVSIKKEPLGDKKQEANLLLKEHEVSFQIGGSSSNGKAEPFELNNFLPLTSFTVRDTGAEIFTDRNGIEDTKLEPGAYTITEIQLGKASYSEHIKDYDGMSVQAKVTVELWDGKRTEIGTYDVSSLDKGAVHSIPVTIDGVKGFEVEYFDSQLQAAPLPNGNDIQRSLGSDVVIEPITVKMKLKKQAEGPDAIPAKLVRNHSEVSVKYLYPTQERDVYEERALETQKAVAEIELDPQFDLPEIALDLQVLDIDRHPVTTVTIGETITYRMVVSNESKKDLNFENPIISDKLSKHIEVIKRDGEAERFIITYPSGDWSRDEGKKVFTDGPDGQYLNLWLKGNLKPGEEIVIEFDAKVLPTVVETDNLEILDSVYVTSLMKGIQWQGNPYGMAFTPVGGGALEYFPNVDAALEFQEKKGYIYEDEIVRAVGSHHVTRSKSINGNGEDSYSDPEAYLSEGQNAMVLADGTGEIRYKLTLTNNSEIDQKKVRIADILPAEGDVRLGDGTPRHSVWTPYFKEIVSVTLYDAQVEKQNGETVITDVQVKDAPYTLYSKTGKITGAEASSIPSELSGRENVAGNWISGADNNASVIAFDFDNSVVLGQYDRIEVVYKMGVKQYSSEEMGELAGRLTTNDFMTFTWAGDSQTAVAQNSSPVSALLEGDKVGVGGHIWIDEDQDGIQNEKNANMGGTDGIAENTEVPAVDVALHIYYGNELIDIRSMTTTPGTNEFQFDNLSYSVPSGMTDLYDSDGRLNPNGLTGNKINYQLVITPPEGYALTQSFQPNGTITPSRDPRQFDLFENETKDSNFMSENGSYVSERFYLWPTDESSWDMTKDIGLVKLKDLTIKKEAEGAGAIPLENAKFILYGPFEPESEIGEQDLTDANEAGRVQTDIQGMAQISSLNYYKDYVLVEESAPEGYDKETAKADGMELLSFGTKKGWRIPAKTEASLLMRIVNHLETGKIAIKKISSKNKNALSGAKFTLVYTESDQVKKAKWQKYGEDLVQNKEQHGAMGMEDVRFTDGKLAFTIAGKNGDGTAVLEGVPLGTYQLTETEAPLYYTMPQDPVFTFNLQKNGGDMAQIQVNIENTPEFSMTIEKQAEETVTPSDRIFQFKVSFRKAGDLSYTPYSGDYWIEGKNNPETAKDGIIWLTAGQKAVIRNIDPGTEYEVEEISDSRQNYNPEIMGGTTDPQNPYRVTGKAETESIVLKFDNKLKTGEFKVTKVLEGTLEENEKPEFEMALKFTKDGARIFDPALQPDAPQKLKVTVEGHTGVEERAADLDQTDGSYHLKLKPSETASIRGIYYGTKVEAQELEGDDRYDYDKTKYSGTIAHDLPVLHVTFHNAVRGSLEIIKRDQTNPDRTLPDAEFILQRVSDLNGASDENSGKYVAVVMEEDGIYKTAGYTNGQDSSNVMTTSKAKGSVTIANIEPGKYKLIETKAPQDYEMPENPVTEVEISANDGTGPLTKNIENIPKTGELSFKKILKDDRMQTDEKDVFEFRFKLEGRHGDGKKAVIKEMETEEGIKVTKITEDGRAEQITAVLDEQTGEFSVTLKAEETIKISGIYYGTEYKVYETENLKSGYICNTPEQSGIVDETSPSADLVIENIAPGKLKIIKADEDKKDVRIEGAKFVLRQGDKYVRLRKTEEQGYVFDGFTDQYIPEEEIFATDHQGMASIGRLPVGPYTVQEVEAPKPYKVTAETTDVLIMTGETEHKTITNKKVLPVSVQLNAKKMLLNEDSGRPYKLADGQFEFELYKSEKSWNLEEAQLLETRKNDVQGIVTFSEMTYWIDELGDYYYIIKETADPSGTEMKYDGAVYQIHINIHWKDDREEELEESVTVTRQDKEPTDLEQIQFINTVSKEAEFDLTKVNESDEPLEGTEFTLKKEQDQTTQTSTTGTDGKIRFSGLKEGIYTLKETKTVSGYKNSTDQWIITVCDGDDYRAPLTVTIKKQGEDQPITELKIVNERLTGSLEIIKTDAKDNRIRLQGAEFILRAKSGEMDGYTVQLSGSDGKYKFAGFSKTEEYRVVTDGEGRAIIADLPPGTYEIIEKLSPKGYKMPDQAVTEVTVRADEEAQITRQVIQNEKETDADDVKTGDETNYMKYLWMLFGAALIVAVILVGKHKKNK